MTDPHLLEMLGTALAMQALAETRAEAAEVRISNALALRGTPHADWGGAHVVTVEEVHHALSEGAE